MLPLSVFAVRDADAVQTEPAVHSKRERTAAARLPTGRRRRD